MNAEIGRYLCMKCMRQLGNSPVCPYCGHDNQSPQNAPYLPKRTVLAGRYLVGVADSHNGDGITYVGFDLSQKSPVYIREFFPERIAARARDTKNVLILEGSEILFEDSLYSFLDLWRKLARLRDLSALLPVYDIFEENDTAYAVSEYLDHITLRDYLLQNPTGQLSWEHCRRMFMPVLSTLATLHTTGIVHRGISPTTLIVGEDGKLRLTGFSIKDARTARGVLNPELFPGYAAIEQYGFEGRQGPWTDIYGFAATLYRALVGNTPLESTARVTNDRLMIPTRLAESLPAYVLSALGNAMQILPEDRTQSVEQFRAEISAAPSITVRQPMQAPYIPPVVQQQAPPVQQYPQQPQLAPVQQPVQPVQQSPVVTAPPEEEMLEEEEEERSKAGLIVSIVILVILIIVAIVAVFFFKDKLFPAPVEGESTSISETVSAEDENVVVMPNLVGESYDSVKAFWNGKINIIVDAEQYTEDFPRGTIMDQDIPKGTKCDTDVTVKVVLSKGIEEISFEDNIVGRKSADAKKTLEEKGFKTDVITIYNDGSHEADTVAAIDLDAGVNYPKGTMITLQVWGASNVSVPATGAEDDIPWDDLVGGGQ